MYILSIPFMLNNFFKLILPHPLVGKIQVSDLVFIALFIFFIAYVVVEKRKINLSLKWPFFLYFLVLIFSLINSGLHLNSIIEVFGKLYLLTAVIIVVNIIKNDKDLLFLNRSYVFSAAFYSFIGILGYLFLFLGYDNLLIRHYPNFADGLYRMTSFMVLPNMLYGFLHIGFFAALLGFNRENNLFYRRISFLCIALIFIGIILTFSRGWTAFLFSFWVLSLLRNNVKFITRITLFIIFVLLFVFIQVFITYFTDVSAEFNIASSSTKKVEIYNKPTDGGLYAYNTYFEKGIPYKEIIAKINFLPGWYYFNKKAAIIAFKEHPFFGIGPAGFNKSISKIHLRKDINFPKAFPSSDPHSTYFGSLAETGIFGIVSLLLLLGSIMRIGIRNIHSKNGAYYVAALSGLLLFALDVDIMNFRYLWILFAMVFCDESCVN